MNNKSYIIAVRLAPRAVFLFGSLTKACQALGLSYHFLKQKKISATEPIRSHGFCMWRVGINPLIKLETMSVKTITAEEIINDIVITDDLETMRENLRDLWDNFVISNDTSDTEDRAQMFTTYKTLYDALGKMKSL